VNRRWRKIPRVFPKKEGTTMQRNRLSSMLAAAVCVLILSMLLLVSACGGSSNPGSQPNGTPQATPTKGGYNIISLFEREIQFFLAPPRW